ncbi:hypothetical protein SAMN04487983_1003322 [Streptomyces sp. yr375]|uniref:hypothetical protein n=1 Tax=Streptomyces sp. yr375 TaxID=1761906 RepID=UPI0008BFA8AE|nr:hypothetical protein [Streptomyces sp. yr375]SEQ20886.1 hypothetical protein SAMN04487983_1003322 [Streptomyces sp. yr375]
MAGAVNDNGNERAWRVLAGIGGVGVGIGLIAGVPVLTLPGALCAFVGLIGLVVTRRK